MSIIVCCTAFHCIQIHILTTIMKIMQHGAIVQMVNCKFNAIITQLMTVDKPNHQFNVSHLIWAMSWSLWKMDFSINSKYTFIETTGDDKNPIKKAKDQFIGLHICHPVSHICYPYTLCTIPCTYKTDVVYIHNSISINKLV